MKRLLLIFLVIVAVFCTFAGCLNENKSKNDTQDNGTNVVEPTENGDNDGNDEAGDNGGGAEDDTPTYKVVTPITNGGSFSGDGYND